MAKLHSPNGEGLGLIPGQGTRSHMLQLRPGTAKYINIKKKKELDFSLKSYRGDHSMTAKRLVSLVF